MRCRLKSRPRKRLVCPGHTRSCKDEPRTHVPSAPAMADGTPQAGISNGGMATARHGSGRMLPHCDQTMRLTNFRWFGCIDGERTEASGRQDCESHHSGCARCMPIAAAFLFVANMRPFTLAPSNPEGPTARNTRHAMGSKPQRIQESMEDEMGRVTLADVTDNSMAHCRETKATKRERSDTPCRQSPWRQSESQDALRAFL